MSPIVLMIVFTLSNLLLLPIYIMIVFLPNHAFTRRAMQSLWSVALPCLLAVGFALTFVAINQAMLPRFFQLFPAAVGGDGFALYYQALVDAPPVALVMWLHAIAADAIMARWAYLESRALELPTWPTSVALLLMGTNGPLGFLVYALVRQHTLTRQRKHQHLETGI